MSKKTKAIIYWSVIGILIAVVLFSVGTIIHKMVSDTQNEQQYQDLASNKNQLAGTRPPIPTGPHTTVPTTAPTTQPTKPSAPQPSTTPDTTTTPTTSTTPTTIPLASDERRRHPESKDAYRINNDMVGWIQIPGTTVDYPVVQSKYEKDFYLRRNFYKQNAVCGAIYAREACSIDPASDNVVLYGHNMNNGTMFQNLLNYKKKNYWQSHRYVYFDTLTEYRTYEIFAVFVTSADRDEGFRYHTFNNASSPEAFDEFVAKCKELSYYDTGITPEYGDKLVTLSTCDRTVGYGADGRLVVVARRVV